MSILKENSILESAVNYYEKFTLDKDLLDEYEKHEMYIHRQNDLIEQGREEGQQNKAIEIARNLILNNVDMNIIIASTGLTTNEIEKIKSEM